MRGIPSEEFEKGLSLSSLRLLTGCRSRFEDHFQPKFRDPDEAAAIRDQIALHLHDLKGRVDTFAEAMREMRDELKSVEIETVERSKAQADIVCSGLQKLGSADVEVDPCLRYISTLLHHELYRSRREDLKAVSNDIDAATARVCQSRRLLTPQKQPKQSFVRRVSRLLRCGSIVTRLNGITSFEQGRGDAPSPVAQRQPSARPGKNLARLFGSHGREKLFEVPSRRKIDLEKVKASVNTTCTKCGYSIAPDRLRRIDFYQIECPECGEHFVPEQKPTAGGKSELTKT